MVFEGQDKVLYTKCSYQTEEGVVYCPTPLFSPNAAGIVNVTLLIDNCTTGYSGQYTVGPGKYSIMGQFDWDIVCLAN